MMTISSTPSTAPSTDSVATTNTNTPTSTPSINELRTRSFSVVVTAALIAGGLLALCVVVCTVGILGRKKYKTDKNTRSHGFSGIGSYIR